MARKSKRNGIFLWGSISLLTALGFALGAAFMFGKKSPVYLQADIELSEELRESARGMRTLYIILFDDGPNAMPMPYGAIQRKLSDDASGEFYRLTATPEAVQVMIETRPVPRKWRLKVRLDRDGFGGPDQPGDLVGTLSNIAMGETGLKVTIDKKI